MKLAQIGWMVIGLMILCQCMQVARADDVRVYRGRWQSQSTGHSGPMRVRMTPRSDGSYDARFSGRFLVVVPFTYKVTMQSQGGPSWGDPSGWQALSAHKQLGPLLGGYSMSAGMDRSNLSGSFSAAGDTGQIHMQRVR